MTLTRLEIAWGSAALAAIFPGSSEQGLAAIGTMNVAGYLGEVMKGLPIRAALGLRMAVWIVALAPVFVLGRFVTIARLLQAEREAVIAHLMASESYVLRSLTLFLKTFGALLYAGTGAIRARMNAPPRPSLVPPRLRRVRAA